MDADVIVIGAGVAGLACARRLAAAGLRVIVLEKAKGVGGRCATRRVLDGQPVDHGVAFLHGSDASFLAALDAVDAARLDGWPFRVEGRGVPCQPDAYVLGSRRLAFVDGVSVFPKHLARGLDVRKGVAVSEVEAGRVRLANGEQLTAPRLVLTPPVEQLAALLPHLPELAAAHTLLGWLATVPCLAVLAAYDPGLPPLGFDVLHPEDGPLQIVSHDSNKRAAATHRVLVLQAGARGSEAWLEDPPDVWQERLLEAAAEKLGAWAGAPVWATAHRWLHARFPAGLGLGGPLLVELPEGRWIGLAGEAFAPSGGVEGAFASGERLARRMLGEPS